MRHNDPVVRNVGDLTAAFVSTVNEFCGERKSCCCIISPNIFNYMLAVLGFCFHFLIPRTSILPNNLSVFLPDGNPVKPGRLTLFLVES